LGEFPSEKLKLWNTLKVWAVEVARSKVMASKVVTNLIEMLLRAVVEYIILAFFAARWQIFAMDRR
jgi:hypothetical protein